MGVGKKAFLVAHNAKTRTLLAIDGHPHLLDKSGTCLILTAEDSLKEFCQQIVTLFVLREVSMSSAVLLYPLFSAEEPKFNNQIAEKYYEILEIKFKPLRQMSEESLHMLRRIIDDKNGTTEN
uniref:Uncharacterized protein n=1 Tax=Panagrolaimus sp. ES5 TaxID=591445 RepID=A0AC34GU55_9BILA